MAYAHLLISIWAFVCYHDSEDDNLDCADDEKANAISPQLLFQVSQNPAAHSGGRQATVQCEESAERPSRPAGQVGQVGQVGPGADFEVNLQEGLGYASDSDAQP